ncbi:MAG TPA: hypothetical protein VM120_17030 [Bryobacteraceae bacterium]|nr:hypothetical protein [Bryobacteraceae bacterium]
MTRRLACGLVLVAAMASAASWPRLPFKKSKETADRKEAGRQGFDSTYTGGTIAAIPQFINGKLDLSGKSALQFHYGKPTWSLDYTRITSIEVADKKQVRLVKVPRLMKDKRVFTIGFDNEKGQKQNMILELPVEIALSALPLLEERTGRTAVVEGQMNPDGWWGDRYWKTSRNATVWDEATAANKNTVAQSTK